MTIHTPDWVKHAVFYQIFPDRFARSPRSPLLPGITFKPWGTPPEEQGFQGGDLRGIVDKLDYLQDLGVTALYMNPLFASAANHRYHTYDYMQVDPLLGGDTALRELVDAAHARQMKVVLDGVFNHTGRGFWAFHHILEEGGNSPYLDWFIVQDWPLRPYSSNAEWGPNYDAWWGLPALPKFNIQNPGVRAYLLEVARYWIDFGVDGWRLDVPEDIQDADFWRSFRQVVKATNPEAYIVGEIWNEAREWLQGDRFDAVMNYPLSRIALGFLAAGTLHPDYKPGGFDVPILTAEHFGQQVEAMTQLHDWEITLAQFNVLDSHDTARIYWAVQGDESALRLLALFQMTLPGAPCIYYGTEIGMDGGTDPGCRAAFPWQDPSQWNESLRAIYRKAIQIRHEYQALRMGRFVTLYAQDDVYAFARLLDTQIAVVVLNAGNTPASLDLDLPALSLDAHLADVWQGDSIVCSGGRLNQLSLPARDGRVLIGPLAGQPAIQTYSRDR